MPHCLCDLCGGPTDYVKWKFSEKMENFGFLLKISRFWKIISFNFQRSRLMTLGRVYNHKILFFSQCFGHWRGLSNSNPLVLDGTWMARTRVSSERWWLITEWWSLITGIWWLLRGFTDFAGSAVVHLAGAVLSLPGCVILGARWHLCAGSILKL